MTAMNRVKVTDLFNFQGIRKRILIAPDNSPKDEPFTNEEDLKQIDNEYNELDLTGEQFESYVRPTITQSEWISNRKYERNEINRLGDIIDFYDHKPKLNEFEKRVYKRMTRQDRSVQTDEEPKKNLKTNKDRHRVPIIRLPPPLAMERVEEFLAENHWRLLDLFRKLDKNKSWRVVKEDFMRLAEQEQLNISDAQADELITVFCQEAQIPLDYKRFVRGRSLYKKSIRDNINKTPSSLDTQLESESSTTLSLNYLQLPTTDISHKYPMRDSTSSYSRSTASSLAKYKRASVSTSRTDSKLSTSQSN